MSDSLSEKWIRIFRVFLFATATSIQATDAAQVSPHPSSDQQSGEEGQWSLANDFIRLSPGTKVRKNPSVNEQIIAIVDVEIDLEILDVKGPWRLVRFGSMKGWANLNDPLGKELFVRQGGRKLFDSATLQDVLARFEDTVQAQQLGHFVLYTDVEDRELLVRLGRVATHLPAAYRTRFGIEAGASSSEAVVIFAKSEHYREFEQSNSHLDSTRSHGHAGSGVASLFVDPDDAEKTVGLLIHELVHLLNRRVFQSALAPWLEEGMASELAFSEVGTTGELRLGTLAGTAIVVDHPRYMAGGWKKVNKEVRLTGPKAALGLVKQSIAAGRTAILEDLTRLTWVDFVDPKDRNMRYAHSAFLVRYLLEDDAKHGSGAFKLFLRFLSEDSGESSTYLPNHLNKSWSEIEEGFAAWIAASEM